MRSEINKQFKTTGRRVFRIVSPPPRARVSAQKWVGMQGNRGTQNVISGGPNQHQPPISLLNKIRGVNIAVVVQSGGGAANCHMPTFSYFLSFFFAGELVAGRAIPTQTGPGTAKVPPKKCVVYVLLLYVHPPKNMWHKKATTITQAGPGRRPSHMLYVVYNIYNSILYMQINEEWMKWINIIHSFIVLVCCAVLWCSLGFWDGWKYGEIRLAKN